MLELAREVIGRTHAFRTVLVPLLRRVRARGRAGLQSQLGHRPRKGRVVVDPVVGVDVRGLAPDELPRARELTAVFHERFSAIDRAREELRRTPERAVVAYQRSDPGGIQERPRVGQDEVDADIETWRRRRERCRVCRARRVRHQGRAGDDALALRSHDAVVDARGPTEVVRIHDQEAGQRSSMAARTCHPHVLSRRSASSSETRASRTTISIARRRSFSFVGRRSTIRSSRVRPSFTIDVVDSMFSTSLVAVPAFILLDPAMTSGPTSITMATSAARASAESGLHVIATVPATWRSLFAPSIASTTYGARPLAEIATTTSPAVARTARSRRPRGASSAPSIDMRSAWSPPAMIPVTSSGSTPKVGGISLASRTPSRPLVPAPT